jgi:hypothetical protein
MVLNSQETFSIQNPCNDKHSSVSAYSIKQVFFSLPFHEEYGYFRVPWLYVVVSDSTHINQAQKVPKADQSSNRLQWFSKSAPFLVLLNNC